MVKPKLCICGSKTMFRCRKCRKPMHGFKECLTGHYKPYHSKWWSEHGQNVTWQKIVTKTILDFDI